MGLKSIEGRYSAWIYLHFYLRHVKVKQHERLQLIGFPELNSFIVLAKLSDFTSKFTVSSNLRCTIIISYICSTSKTILLGDLQQPQRCVSVECFVLRQTFFFCMRHLKSMIKWNFYNMNDYYSKKINYTSEIVENA